jgi:hypothetical protein
MSFASRETIFQALFALLCAVKPPKSVCADEDDLVWNETGRDLKSWDQVPAANQPALFMPQSTQHASMETFGLSQWRLSATAWIYYRTDGISDPATPRDQAVNQVIDAIEAAINPYPGELQTLGGLVIHTYIDGAVVFDSGLTDPQAVILVPITMLIGALGI